jgi:TetR/AcrR family transcriptional repressor of nem operon
MPRSREFDPGAAIDHALETFWVKGYEATSMQELVDATGVHRASMYGTFGSKHDLFLATLDRYCELETAALMRQAASAPSPLVAIERILDRFARESAGPGARGCYMVNAIAERAGTDEAVRTRASSALAGLRSLFEEQLTAAQRAGEIPLEKNAVDLAAFLVNTIQGLRVLGKAGTGRASLRAIAVTALDVLR